MTARHDWAMGVLFDLHDHAERAQAPGLCGPRMVIEWITAFTAEAPEWWADVMEAALEVATITPDNKAAVVEFRARHGPPPADGEEWTPPESEPDTDAPAVDIPQIPYQEIGDMTAADAWISQVEDAIGYNAETNAAGLYQGTVSPVILVLGMWTQLARNQPDYFDRFVAAVRASPIDSPPESIAAMASFVASNPPPG